MNTIQSEIQRLDKIVNNFLSFIRSENLQKSETDVNQLIDEVLRLYNREMSEQKVRLKTDYANNLTLPLDAERFKAVVANIVLNALQAMPNGGELIVSTNTKERAIIFKDTGIGISAKNLENIFDIFYTTKSTGTGLGLPTAYKIVKEHGAEMEIRSSEGKGTEVQIQF